MNNERSEFRQNNEDRSGNPAEQQRPGAQGPAGSNQPVRRGPFTYAVGWLGTAFDRSQINKREAEERRRRNM